ncbi:MAG: hypothetical protein FWG98_05260 [Candidatus Cloacimonetes bacterium]|nr:hypothetical protein [Candidatus Cloacimonadota bacterium]
MPQIFEYGQRQAQALPNEIGDFCYGAERIHAFPTKVINYLIIKKNGG